MNVCEMSNHALRNMLYKQPSENEEEMSKARTELNRRMKEHEMLKEWESWSWLIRDDIERLENRLQACYEGMMTAGVPKDMREAFVLNKLQEIILSVTSAKA